MKRILAVAACATGSEADFGFRAGYQRFTEADDGAFMGGAFLRLPWRSVILGEGALMYHKESVGDVDLEIIPVQLSLMLFFLRRDLDFCPYLLAGAGTYITRRVEQDGGDSDTDIDIGWHLGFGLDYLLNDRIFVEGDFRYIWLDVDFGGQTVGEKLTNFNNWMANIGIGFRL